MTNGSSSLIRSTTVAQPDRSMVNIGVSTTPQVQRLYSIFLWDLEMNRIVIDPTVDPARRHRLVEFYFFVPPKSVDMTEPYATHVIATQNGGKFIESQGSLFKDIRVTGTTGLRPRPKAPRVIPLLSIDTTAFETLLGGGFSNQARKVPEDEITGFDDIHLLRNIFRRYSDSKARGERFIMVWRNIKDDDYWVVEPKDFKLITASSSPLTYQYQISMQGLAPFDPARASVADVQDPQAVLKEAERFYSRMQEYKGALLDSFLIISTSLTTVRGAGYGAIDGTMGTLTSIIKGMNSVKSSGPNEKHRFLQQVEQGKREFDEAIYALIPTLEPPLARPPLHLSQAVERRSTIIRTLRNSLRVFDKLLTEPELQDNASTDADDRSRRMADRYVSSGTGTGANPPRSGGDPTSIHNSATPSTVASGTVGTGESIRDLASRLLGDGRRWHELVLINDLRAPYVSDGALTDGVLAPGDSILYPSRTAVKTSSVQSINQSPDEAENQDANLSGVLAQTYGRDIRLKSSGNDLDLTDLVVNQKGDISTIVGVPNVDQAVKIKFSTEVGELAAHPSFGAKYPIGSKADISSFNSFRIDTLSTFRSDHRIQDVIDLKFAAIGDVLTVSAKLLLQDAREYLSTDFALRRF